MRKNMLVYIFLIIILIFTNADNVIADNSYTYSVDAIISSLSGRTRRALYCKAGGCRVGSNFGIRVTLIDKNGKQIIGTKSIDYIYGKSSYGTGTVGKSYKTAVINNLSVSAPTKKNMNTLPVGKKGSVCTKNISVPTLIVHDNISPDFSNVVKYFKAAADEFSECLELGEEVNFADSKAVKKYVSNLNSTAIGQLLKQLQYTINVTSCETVNILKNLYILIEPISTITEGTLKAWHNGEPLSDEVIDEIKKIGSLSVSLLLSDGVVRNGMTGKEIAEYIGISGARYDVVKNYYYKSLNPATASSVPASAKSSINSFLEMLRQYNQMYNSVKEVPATSARFIGTSSEIGKRIYTAPDKRIYGYKNANGTGGLIVGSVGTHVGNIGHYLYLNEKVSSDFYYQPVSGMATSWNQLYTNKGYGMGVIKLSSKVNFSCEEKKCAITEKGDKLKSYPDKKNEKYCCDLEAWPELTEKAFDQNIVNSTWYKNTCVDYCKIVNNKMEVPKTRTIKECCLYKNYGPNQQTRTKNSTFDSKERFENSDVYKKYCTTPPKCTSKSVISTKTDDCCIKTNYETSIATLSDIEFKEWLKTNNPSGYDICFYEPPEEITSECQYTVSTDCPNCENTVATGYVRDVIYTPTGKDEWACIYESTGMWRNNYYNKSYGYGGNNYCSIYCIEDISITYPNGGFSVKNGSKITIGENKTWGPLKIEGVKTCRTDKINYEQFNKDFDATNDQVGKTWTEYMKQLARHEKVTSSPIITTNSNCGCKYSVTDSDPNGSSHTLSCCTAMGFTPYQYKVTLASADCKKQLNPDTGKEEETCVCSIGTLDGKSCVEERTGYNANCTAPDNTYNDSYSPVTYSYVSADGVTLSGSEGAICVASYSSGVSTAYAAYTNAHFNRQSTLTAINNCAKWERALNYDDFNPEINISYTDEVYSLFDTALVGNMNASTTPYYDTDYGWITAKPSDAKKIGYVCENRSCKKEENFAYPTVEYVEVVYNKKYNYTLPQEIFRYVLKETNESVSTRPSTPNYVDIGYGNLPVSLSSKGEYDISLELVTLGVNNKLNSFVFGEKQEYLTGNCENIYSCKYYVNEEIQLTKKGLNLIYRPISLTHPFPGQSGTSRKRGSNWDSDTLVANYITNSRGVKEYELYYKKDPLYAIELTPALILEIREYNSTTNYADYNLKCIDGEKCKSDFIRNSKFSKYFTGCRINDSSQRCNKGEAW